MPIYHCLFCLYSYRLRYYFAPETNKSHGEARHFHRESGRTFCSMPFYVKRTNARNSKLFEVCPRSNLKIVIFFFAYKISLSHDMSHNIVVCPPPPQIPTSKTEFEVSTLQTIHIIIIIILRL